MTDAPDSPYRTLSTKTVYQTPWIEIKENKVVHPDGRDGIYSTVHNRDGVIVVAVDTDDKILLISAFSYAAQKWQWKLPVGGIEDEEEIVGATQRELKEETGFTAEHFEQIGLAIPLSNVVTGRVIIVLAANLKPGNTVPADDSGTVKEQKFFTLDQIDDMILSGEIDNGNTILAIHYYALHSKQRSAS
jgi:ADP-ribose pyrophosphatase YjhB (NUDIX family)